MLDMHAHYHCALGFLWFWCLGHIISFSLGVTTKPRTTLANAPSAAKYHLGAKGQGRRSGRGSGHSGTMDGSLSVFCSGQQLPARLDVSVSSCGCQLWLLSVARSGSR
ncbi:hypothetical protein BD289DRAFT_429872 [Coniella lustricola]|uniref:Secreted protein n=1 Tax=Coniella lustricola TaxID=2025994 RepID=A0A2T3ACE0_9PEZI|nr:hypothetical protein BD289DRAFT_429872 [Coniella lustricola]